MSIKGLVEAFQALELDKEHQAILKEYELLQDENEHDDALILICKFFKRQDLVEKMNHIKSLHDLYGSLIPPLAQMRNEIDMEIKERFLMEFKGYTAEDAEQYVNELKAL